MSAFHKRIGEAFQPNQPNNARLQQLSNEVGRIAAALAQLSTVPEEPELRISVQENDKAPAVSLQTVNQVIRARRLRARYFDQDLFSDPAWDILLDLLRAEIAQHRVSVTSLCVAAAVPPTTALRWIQSMTDAGLLQRRPDPSDARRKFLELSPSASMCMRRFFRDIGAAAAA